MAEFRVLGPVELWDSDQRIDLGTVKQRVVFAILALEMDRTVTVDALVDRVWDDAPPAKARAVLQSHVSRIRAVLARTGLGSLCRQTSGYLLHLDRARVDLYRSRDLVAAAETAATPQRRGEILAEALGLWRGEPLAGLPGDWIARMRQTLCHQRWDTLAGWADTQLELGRYEPLVAALRPLAADQPLPEPLLAALLTALSGLDRDVEALELYERCRQLLATELGTDPGPRLRAVHQRILQRTCEVAPAPVAPAQLPPDLPSFTGRAAQLTRLDRLLTPGATVAVNGPAGIGKTALAVHWAHRARGGFPDGQLYVDLRGYAPGPAPSIDQVLLDLLDALGEPASRVPASREGRIGRYRSLLADRRVLLVLDNARDAEQVRPLLPASPGCVLVTSRDQLPGLIAAGIATPLPLELLSTAEAADLLTGRLGVSRVAAEPTAVDRIIDGCGGLPLALGLAAARARLHTDFTLDQLADELQVAPERLDALEAGDGITGVRAVVSWSYRAVDDDSRALFRAVSRHPGPDLTGAAAASLVAWPLARTRAALTTLARASLLVESAPGRYSCHDLLRVYGAELAAAEETAEQRRAALLRMCDHYAHTAHAAALLLSDPQPVLDTDPAPGVVVAPPDTRAGALAWFERELSVLDAVLHIACDEQLDRHCWLLPWATYLPRYYRGQWTEQIAAQRIALAAAQRLGAAKWEAYSEWAIAVSLQRLGDDRAAVPHFRRSVATYQRLGDTASQIRARLNLATLQLEGEDAAGAERHARAALTLARRSGERLSIARSLDYIGWCQLHGGQPARAIRYLRRALTAYRDLDDGNGEASVADTLGSCWMVLDQHRKAIRCYELSLRLIVALDDQYHVATVLDHLGDAWLRAEDLGRARALWTRAATILQELDHPDAAGPRGKLADPPSMRPTGT